MRPASYPKPPHAILRSATRSYKLPRYIARWRIAAALGWSLVCTFMTAPLCAALLGAFLMQDDFELADLYRSTAKVIVFCCIYFVMTVCCFLMGIDIARSYGDYQRISHDKSANDNLKTDRLRGARSTRTTYLLVCTIIGLALGLGGVMFIA